jgi:hypothetical protein
MQCRNRLQVETCLIYAHNVNFEKLNFDPLKNDYRCDMCFCLLCLIIIAPQPGKKPFAVQLNNNNNNNNESNT